MAGVYDIIMPRRVNDGVTRPRKMGSRMDTYKRRIEDAQASTLLWCCCERVQMARLGYARIHASNGVVEHVQTPRLVCIRWVVETPRAHTN